METSVGGGGPLPSTSSLMGHLAGELLPIRLLWTASTCLGISGSPTRAPAASAG